jgi:hypothetical protein
MFVAGIDAHTRYLVVVIVNKAAERVGAGAARGGRGDEFVLAMAAWFGSSQSGQRAVRYGEIPRGANRWLRGSFVRAVVTHCQYAQSSWLTQYYLTQKTRLGWQVARIAAARKLARAVHAMLRDNHPWKNTDEPQRGELLFSHAAKTAWISDWAPRLA